MKLYLLKVFSAALFVCTITGCGHVSSRPPEIPIQIPGQPKVYVSDFSLPDPTGNYYSLSEYRGQYVLLNFFATWCRLCMSEMSALKNLHERLHDKGFTVLAVSADDNAEDFAVFFKSRGYPFPMVRDGTGSTRKAFHVSGVPATFFIAPDGSLVPFLDPTTNELGGALIGPRDWDSPRMVQAFEAFLKN